MNKPEDFGIKDYEWDNGYLNVNGDVDLSDKGLVEIPFKFGYVGGNFCCSINLLVSLEGCPEKVGGGFYCSKNRLVSLEGCPSSINGDFDCSWNRLVSLEGCPKEVIGVFNCDMNHLVSLAGGPSFVGRDFYCRVNKLESLKGCPKEVIGRFPIDDTKEIRALIRKHFGIKFKSKTAKEMMEEYFRMSNAEKFIWNL